MMSQPLLSELKEKSLLISILLLLAIIKFVFLPLGEWQNEIITSTAMMNKKVIKMESLLERETWYDEQLEDLTGKLSEIETYFYEANTETALKLAAQKSFEEFAAQHNVTVTRFNWKKGVLTEPAYKIHIFEASVQARSYAVIRLLDEVTSYSKIISLEEFNLDVKSQDFTQLGVVSGKLVFHVYQKAENE